MRIKLPIKNKKTNIIILSIFTLILLGSGIFLLWRVNQEETVAPEDSEAGCPSGYSYKSMGPDDCNLMASNQKCMYCVDNNWTNSMKGCYKSGPCKAGIGWISYKEPVKKSDPTPNCGTEPTGYSFNKAPTSNIGPFPEDGTVVLYFKNLLTVEYRPLLTFKDANDQTYSIKIPALDGNNRARVVTEMEVKAGEYITLVQSDDDMNNGNPSCAPTAGPPYLSWGWIAPSGGTCGSGLQGPPGGIANFGKPSVASDVTWAQSFGYDIVGKGSQCWADWREWPGDYDFNDYFLQISYEPLAEVLTPDWVITKNAAEVCLNEDTETPTSEISYTVSILNQGQAEGYIDKIVDQLDTKVLDEYISNVTEGGVVSEGTISWELETDDETFLPDQEKTYTYTLSIPFADFGQYENIVTATTRDGDTIQATKTMTADCEMTPEEEEVIVEDLPETGLFGDSEKPLVAGIALIFLGFAWNLFGSKLLLLTTSIPDTYQKTKKTIQYQKSEQRRKKFEKKVVKSN